MVGAAGDGAGEDGGSGAGERVGDGHANADGGCGAAVQAQYHVSGSHPHLLLEPPDFSVPVPLLHHSTNDQTDQDHDCCNDGCI